MTTVDEQLKAWLLALEPWQQDLVRRLTDRPALEGVDLEEALLVIRGVFGALADGEVAIPPTILEEGEIREPRTVPGAPRLLNFGRMRGVGAVSADGELTFAAKGLTLIYGQNAAGKSTYVRGLKRICRTVDCDAAILGNVFASGIDVSPTAAITLSTNDQATSRQVKLDQPEELGLDALSVFDARCAELYVDSRNAVAFIPSSLLLLTRLAATQDAMRKELHHQELELARSMPTFGEFDRPSKAKQFVDALDSQSEVEEAQRRAELTEQQRQRVVELRAALGAAAAPSATADAQAARSDASQADSLRTQFETLARATSTASADAIKKLAERVDETRAAADLARKEFDSLSVPGVGGEPWRVLWDAAKSFVAAGGGAFPPTVEGVCPLCLQTIPATAAEQLRHLEKHVLSNVAEQQRLAEEALTNALASLDGHSVAGCRTAFLDGMKVQAPELHAKLESFLDGVDVRMTAIRDRPLASDHPAVSSPPLQGLDDWSKARRERAEMLLAAIDPSKQHALRAELEELEGSEKLSQRLDDVSNAIALHRRIDGVRRAHSALATNRITTKQKSLAEEAITEGLGGKLADELRQLRCQHLTIELEPHAAVGEMQVGLRLAGAHGVPRLSEIASEGEQRALSLAFFFAEVGTSENDGGIIVDDPVSSLDDERREHIAKRLIAEAGRRQVIVFTHDLPFTLDLLEGAKGAGVATSVQAVWRLGAEVGRVDDHPPFKAMNLRERVGVLDQRVATWDKQEPPKDFDEAWDRVCSFYRDLRTSWERAVEERLFRGVVQRFQREVKTLKLSQVAITPELIAAIDEGMTRCSMFVHDEPPGSTISLPDRTQLASDLSKISEFEKMTRSKS